MDDCFISSVFLQISFVPFLMEKPWDYDKTLILRNIVSSRELKITILLVMWLDANHSKTRKNNQKNPQTISLRLYLHEIVQCSKSNCILFFVLDVRLHFGLALLLNYWNGSSTKISKIEFKQTTLLNR